MARIDSRNYGPVVDAKRGHRPIRLVHPHTGPFAAPEPDPRDARRHARTQAKARAQANVRATLDRLRNATRKA